MISEWSRSPDLAWVANGDRVVLLRLDFLIEPPLILTGSAALVWRLLDGRSDADAVVDAVSLETGEAAERVRSDVHAFVDDLLGRGVLVRPAGPDGSILGG